MIDWYTSQSETLNLPTELPVDYDNHWRSAVKPAGIPAEFSKDFLGNRIRKDSSIMGSKILNYSCGYLVVETSAGNLQNSSSVLTNYRRGVMQNQTKVDVRNFSIFNVMEGKFN